HGAHRDLHSFPTRRSSDLCCLPVTAHVALTSLRAHDDFGGRLTMPMTELPGHHVPIRLWADPATVEPKALQQLFNVTTLPQIAGDRKSTRLNSSHDQISYA